MGLLVMLLYPGLMVPPYTIRAGLFRRAIAMTTPGMFLSHPGSEIFASYHCIDISMFSTLHNTYSADGQVGKWADFPKCSNKSFISALKKAQSSANAPNLLTGINAHLCSHDCLNAVCYEVT